MFLPLRLDTLRLRVPSVTLALVAASLALFAYEMTLPEPALARFARAAGAVPWEIAHRVDAIDAVQPRDLVPPPLTILTSWFVHGDPLHLAGNVWFLWLFGATLEGRLGASRFLLLYVTCGLVAASLQILAAPESTVPMIGASGAIAGVLGAYARTFPRAQARCLVFVLFFVTFATLPAGVLLALWFLGQLAAASGKTPGVAWYAHIGGFVTGFLLSALLVRAWRPATARIGYSPANAGAVDAEAGGGGAGARPFGPDAPVPAA